MRYGFYLQPRKETNLTECRARLKALVNVQRTNKRWNNQRVHILASYSQEQLSQATDLQNPSTGHQLLAFSVDDEKWKTSHIPNPVNLSSSKSVQMIIYTTSPVRKNTVYSCHHLQLKTTEPISTHNSNTFSYKEVLSQVLKMTNNVSGQIPQKKGIWILTVNRHFNFFYSTYAKPSNHEIFGHRFGQYKNTKSQFHTIRRPPSLKLIPVTGL